VQIVDALLPDGQYRPVEHVNCVGEDEPFPQKYPAEHGPLTALNPVELQKEPASQLSDEIMPSNGQ